MKTVEQIKSEITQSEAYISGCEKEIEDAEKKIESAKYRKLQYVSWKAALKWILEP